MRWLLVGRSLRSFSQSYLAVLVPLYLLARGASAAQVGGIVAFWTAGGALLALLAGFVADRYGRKSVLLLFSVLTAISAFAFLADAPMWVLAIAGALGTIGRGGSPASGGAFGPYFSAEQALVAEYARGGDRTRTFARLSSVASLSGAFGFAVTGAPALFASLHWPRIAAFHAIFALTGLIGIALSLSVLPLREAHRIEATGRGRIALSKVSRGIVARLAVTNATNGLAVGFLGSMLVLWFHVRYGADAHQIGLAYFAIALCVSLAFTAASRLERAIGGAVRTVVALRVVSCALLALMPFMPTFTLAALVYLVRMLFNSVTISVRQSYVMGIVPPPERSRVASLSNLPSQIGSTLGPSVAGALLEYVWDGAILEAAAFFQLLNAALYYRFFHAIAPPEERESAGASAEA